MAEMNCMISHRKQQPQLLDLPRDSGLSRETVSRWNGFGNRILRIEFAAHRRRCLMSGESDSYDGSVLWPYDKKNVVVTTNWGFANSLLHSSPASSVPIWSVSRSRASGSTLVIAKMPLCFDCLCLSLPLSVRLSVGRSVSVSLCVSLSVSVCVSLCVSLSLCLCLSLSLCLCLSLSFFPLSLSLCLKL